MRWNVTFSLKVVHVLDRQRSELRKEAYMYAKKLVTDPEEWSAALPSPPYPLGLRALEFYMDLAVEGEGTFETVMVRLILSIDHAEAAVNVLLIEFE